MSRTRILAVLAALVVGCAAPVAAPAPAEPVPPAPAAEPGVPAEVSVTPADQTIEFQVALRLPGRAALERYLADVQDPSSGSYREFLDGTGFASRFALGDERLADVRRWLEAGGLRVTGGDGARTFLTVRGRVEDVNRRFEVRMVEHVDAAGVRYHAPDREPRIPASLRDAIAGVAGLDTAPRIRPMFVPPIADVRAGGMLPRDGALAYDYAPLHDAGITGQGQTVAIISFDSFLPSDVAAFDQLAGITGAPDVEQRPVPETYSPVVGDGSVEVNLDIDIIRAIAPQAQIIDYEADPRAGFPGVFAAVLDDGRADIVSLSWGGCEIDWPEADRQLTDIQLLRAFVSGVSIFAASGDTGVYSCAHHRDALDERLSGVYPSTTPYVTSVGGTFLWVREDGTYLRERAWEEGMRKVATGGGPSVIYERPDWQVAPGVDTSAGAMRQTPDVAAAADGESGYLMVYTPVGASQPVRGVTSGTSAAAPFWAGSMVLIRQLVEREGLLPIGTASPLLYELYADDPTPFHDVTLGGNLLAAAGPGWDASTGLGSPDVTLLARAIVERLAEGG